MCITFIILCVLASVPAESVAAQPQLQSIRLPSIVELAPDSRRVPRETTRAALSDRCYASV